MTVLIANNVPDRIRGCLKTWFVEPKAGVFVSAVSNALAQKIVQFLASQCLKEHEFILLQQSNEGLGYKIVRIGRKDKRMYTVSGLDLF